MGEESLIERNLDLNGDTVVPNREWVHVIVEPYIVYCGCNFSLGYGQLLLK